MADSSAKTGTKVTRKKVGRRVWKPRWLVAYEKYGTVTAACKAVGVTRAVAYRAQRDDPEFAEAWDAIRQGVIDRLEKIALERAEDGSDNLLQFMLRSLRPEQYGTSVKLAHTGELTPDIEERIDREIRAGLGELAGSRSPDDGPPGPSGDVAS